MKKKLSITDRVQSFEDACGFLNLDPKDLPVVDHLPEKDRRSIIAYYKLTIIIRALNEGWEPDFTNRNQWKYYNWFYFDFAGFAGADANYAAAGTATSFGSRLCFKDPATAAYARKKFWGLYCDYLFIEQPKNYEK